MVGMKIVLAEQLHLHHIPAELYQWLTHTLKFSNPKWAENERMGRWNKHTPKELTFFTKTGRNGLVVPRGFTRRLILQCREQQIEYTLDDRRRTLPPVSFEFQGHLKPFQQTAVDTMQARDFGTLAAPTGSGKTVIALALIARRAQPALIIVHTRELAHQWRERIRTFLHLDDPDTGLIGDGQSRLGHKITVALVQSLYKTSLDMAAHTGFVVVDECHRCPSRTFTEVLTTLDSRYMLGLSATPWRRDKLSTLIFWYLGDLHYRIEARELVASGDVLAPEIIIRPTAFQPFHDAVTEYSRMLAELTADAPRNHLIAADVAREAQTTSGTCLVLSDRKTHCQTLQALLRYKYHTEAHLLTGDLRMSQRRDVLAGLQEGRIKIVIATGQLIGEGFDYPDFTALFLATPIGFSGRITQYLGRILRTAPGKTRPRVYDYVDVQVGVLQKAAASRQYIYRNFAAKN